MHSTHHSVSASARTAVMQNVTHLLRTRRFLPIFATQFLGAFNDNLFSTAMVMFVIYQHLSATRRGGCVQRDRAAGCSSCPSSSSRRWPGSSPTRIDKAQIDPHREDGRDRHHGRRRGRTAAAQHAAAARRADWRWAFTRPSSARSNMRSCRSIWTRTRCWRHRTGRGWHLHRHPRRDDPRRPARPAAAGRQLPCRLAALGVWSSR